MSSLAFWLVCLASAGLAFFGVYRLRWRLTLAMLAGTVIALLLSLPILALTPAEDRSPWFQVELVLNGSVGLIFAGFGAAVAQVLAARRADRDGSTD